MQVPSYRQLNNWNGLESPTVKELQGDTARSCFEDCMKPLTPKPACPVTAAKSGQSLRGGLRGWDHNLLVGYHGEPKANLLIFII